MNKKKSNSKKAVMIGCGFVGSASVFALMQSGLFTEIALIDADKNKAEGEAMDISHGIPFASPMKIYAGDYDDVADAVKNSAYEIINKKHATYYGIAMSVKRICEVIMRDEKSILPVSHMIHGVYEIDDVVLSMPVIVGADGIESDIPINLSGEEALKLKESADALKNIIETLEL